MLQARRLSSIFRRRFGWIHSDGGSYKQKDAENILATLKGGSVDLNFDAKIALVKINNPKKKNAISGTMMLDLQEVTIELSKWNEGKAIILLGEGNMFCAGSDLAAFQSLVSPKEGANVCMYMQNTLYAFQCLPMVSLAYIEGKAMGGGAEVVTACDFRLMHESAEIQFVQRRLGLIPGWGGTTRLRGLIGRQRAMGVLMSGLGVGAVEALSMGLVDGVGCEPHVWLDAMVGGVDGNVLKTIKLAVNQRDFKTDQQSLQREIELIYKVWGGPANIQAINAIKRKE
ncbi:TC10 protein [Ciona intestinalis]